jgi:hypothetical protein
MDRSVKIDTGLLLRLDHRFREERFLISRNIRTKWSTYWNVPVYKTRIQNGKKKHLVQILRDPMQKSLPPKPLNSYVLKVY